VFAANFIWRGAHGGEQLVLVVHLEPARLSPANCALKLPRATPPDQLQARPWHRRLPEDFPLTTSLKIIRKAWRNAWRTGPEQCRPADLALEKVESLTGRTVRERFLAIVNPAAARAYGETCRSAACAPAGGRPRGRDRSTGPGHAAQLAREPMNRAIAGFSRGGDGTAHEILNGISGAKRLPSELNWIFAAGTGNSFLRDFTKDGARSSIEALLAGRKRRVDLLRLRHATELFIPSIFERGFTADVGALATASSSPLGTWDISWACSSAWCN